MDTLPEGCIGTPQDAIARKLELIRRGNPSMGGPNAIDYRNADDILGVLKAYGYKVVPLQEDHKEVEAAAWMSIFHGIQLARRELSVEKQANIIYEKIVKDGLIFAKNKSNYNG